MVEVNSENFWDFLDEQESKNQFVIFSPAELKQIFEDVIEDGFKDRLEDYKDECDRREGELIDWIEHEWIYISQENSICSTNEYLSKQIQKFLEPDF